MAKFRIKNSTVEAMQFDGSQESAEAIVAWAGAASASVYAWPAAAPSGGMEYAVSAKVDGGTSVACKYDWIVRSSPEKLQLYRPTEFSETFEAVDEGELRVLTSRSIRVLQVGDENWDPSNEEMAELANLFLSADLDPLGAVVTTRVGVNPAESKDPSGG
jgi:hypothetical protein